jgi:DNA-binding winged helix-turn-helix (wHTH) protein
MRYIFGDCELEPQRYELRRHGQVRPIEPQVFDVLVLLIRERYRVVTKQELLDTVWGHRFVGESALTSRIKSLRQAVGDDGTAQGIVRTVRRRGYQFVAHVIERPDPSTPPHPRPVPYQHTAPAVPHSRPAAPGPRDCLRERQHSGPFGQRRRGSNRCRPLGGHHSDL